MIFYCARPTRGVLDRALREHRRSSGSIPSSVLRARRAPGHSLPILPGACVERVAKSTLTFIQRGGWLWSPLRASSDHRFIVGALRAQRPHQLPRHLLWSPPAHCV